MMDPDEIITVADVRDAGYCLSGARRWFNTQGLDYKAFIRTGGIKYSAIAKYHDDDIVVQRVVAKHKEKMR